MASLPPLEWPLPSRTDQYELQVEVQPKPHHRAHYETEGSRGAVKAPNGSHPVVQVRVCRRVVVAVTCFHNVHRTTGGARPAVSHRLVTSDQRAPT